MTLSRSLKVLYGTLKNTIILKTNTNWIINLLSEPIWSDLPKTIYFVKLQNIFQTELVNASNSTFAI